MELNEFPPKTESAPTSSKPLVLVVDDNPDYAKLFELLSDQLGIRAHIVSCCVDAMHSMEMFAFDVIIMDWVMPEVDGPTCARKIRQKELETGRRTTIIGVSGYEWATLDSCLAAGMDDYLPIPFTLEELNEKLSLWLPNRES